MSKKLVISYRIGYKAENSKDHGSVGHITDGSVRDEVNSPSAMAVSSFNTIQMLYTRYVNMSAGSVMMEPVFSIIKELSAMMANRVIVDDIILEEARFKWLVMMIRSNHTKDTAIKENEPTRTTTYTKSRTNNQ